MWATERARLTRVARGDARADRVVQGGLLLNVYTGETYPADVAIAGERIAAVGRCAALVGPRTDIIDARGRTLVPGYIEPHAHPWNLTTPAALARHVLPLGTTAIVGDNLVPYELAGRRGFEAAAAALANGPLRFYWMVRPHGQSAGRRDAGRFRLAEIRRMLARPWAAALGEVTRWPDLVAGRLDLLARVGLAHAAGKRVEGHTAGASSQKVGTLAAAGITSDHEPITAEEALDRARQGIALMLRQSSLRPDLRGLLAPFVKAGALGRVMLTTDGSMPAFVARHGFVDHLVRVALDAGVPPLDAYRMVTLNPAAYYGLDADLGGIAPGRYADIALLEDPAEPRPAAVIARGRLAARGGQLLVPVPEPRWGQILPATPGFASLRRIRAADLEPGAGSVPVLKLVSAVITRLEERPIGPGDLRAALIDRRSRRVTTAALSGFAPSLDGLATTLSADHQVLALGRRADSMARAIDRLARLGGGVVLADGERIAFELPLPIGGLMSPRPLAEVARGEQALHRHLQARGYRFHEPVFTLLFLTADFLPSVRLSARGVWDVKRARVIRAGRPLRPDASR